MVIGNNPQITASLFAPQYTMSAVLANEFAEAADDLYLSALIEIGLVLFAITLMVNMASRVADLADEPAGQGASRGALCRSTPRRREVRHEARRSSAAGSPTIVVWLCGLSVLVALVPLAFILFFVVSQGVQALNWAFFTALPAPVGELGGGFSNAIVGTLMLVGIGAAFAVPIGIISGIYIAEFPGDQARHHGALRGGHAEWRAVDCRRGLRLRHRGDAVPPVQRAWPAGWRSGS